MLGRICSESRGEFKEGGPCLILDLDRYRLGDASPVVWWGEVKDLGESDRVQVVIMGGRFDQDTNSNRFVMTEERDHDSLAENHYVFPDTGAFRAMLLKPELLSAHMRLVLGASVLPSSEPYGIAFMT